MESNGPVICRIALCASDLAVRERIHEIVVAAGHDVVAVEGSLERLITSAHETRPELIVLAPRDERFTPAPEIAMLRARLSQLPIVIVTTGREVRAARKLVLAEAHGIVHEAALEHALPATIQCVLADQLCLPAWLRDALAQPVLTHREKQVLELVLAGLTNGEIAAQLFLSESTVKSHLASSFRKLGVSSRLEVAQRLGKSGLDGFWQATSPQPIEASPLLT